MASPFQIYCSYGNYQHQPGEVEYSISRQAIQTERLATYAERWTVQIQGRLEGESTSEVESKLKSLLVAYRKPNQAFVINIGSGASIVSLFPDKTINGVRVTVPPGLPSNRNASHVTYLDYTATVEAEIPIVEQLGALRSFSETLRFSGGGPRYKHLETIDTPPVKQLVKRFTTFTVTQSGRAVGLFRRPSRANPIWPSAVVDSGDYEIDSGKLIGDTLQDLTTSWTYRFESAFPLYGQPNTWGR